jgi:hypothetical protein
MAFFLAIQANLESVQTMSRYKHDASFQDNYKAGMTAVTTGTTQERGVMFVIQLFLYFVS